MKEEQAYISAKNTSSISQQSTHYDDQTDKKSILDRYEIVKQVYKADIGNTCVSFARLRSAPSESHRLVIIKEIDLSLLSNDEYVNQSRREFAIQMEMKHENIVQCLEVEQEGQNIRAVLEFVNEPEYLQIRLDDDMESISDENMLKTFMVELLSAVAYIHKRNIVHCDIKVENILGQVSGDQSFPSLKLCDFGLARRVDPVSQVVHISKKMGTREYMAPEIKDNSFISTKVDIWSLGLVFYKMVTTYLPNQLCRDWVTTGQSVPIRDSDWTGIQPELKALIKSMLSLSPSARPSAQEALSHACLAI